MVATKTSLLFSGGCFTSCLGSFALAAFASEAAALFCALAGTVLAVMTSGCGLALGFVEIILELRQDLPVIRCVSLRVKREGAAEVTAHIQEHFDAKVEPFADALGWPTEAGFASVRVDQRELPPHHDPSCRLF